jgi:hypothetical protein
MANAFSKEETVAFDNLLEGFNDALVMSSLVSKYNFGDVTAERSNDTIWRPQPYIGITYDGLDQTANFGDATQMSVPASLGYKKSAPFKLSATDLRDGSQETGLVAAARQKLASDINVACLATASTYGSLVVKRTAAATGYDDVAEADAIMNEQGVPMGDRVMALSSRDYNKMASNLAQRQTMNEMPTKAYRQSYVGDVAGFETHKLDYAKRLAAATATGVTMSAANQRYVPKATSTASTGETANVDNRFQTISVAVTASTIKVGDAFTIAGVNSVHHITKEDTGQLKTFRVVEIVTGAGGSGTIKITPAIVAADVTPNDAQKRYQNVSATPANGAAITFLNTVTAAVNPFWHKSSLELIPANYVVGNNGLVSMVATTDQGISVRMTREGTINDLSTKYRLDVFFGTVALQPEMMGIEIFAQT